MRWTCTSDSATSCSAESFVRNASGSTRACYEPSRPARDWAPVDVVELVVALPVILLGAEVFTNGVEWVGEGFGLSEGAVGSVLAAIGTALPETILPIVAIAVGGGNTGNEVGIGAILGSPLMLSTLALFILGVTVLASRKRSSVLSVTPAVIRQDLGT